MNTHWIAYICKAYEDVLSHWSDGECWRLRPLAKGPFKDLIFCYMNDSHVQTATSVYQNPKSLEFQMCSRNHMSQHSATQDLKQQALLGCSSHQAQLIICTFTPLPNS